MTPRTYSLRWRLIIRLAIMQALVVLAVVLAVCFAMWRSGWIPDDRIIPTIAASVEADGAGIRLNREGEFESLEARYPGLWFIVQDASGRRLVGGQPPVRYAEFAGDGQRLAGFERIDVWTRQGRRSPEAFFQTVMIDDKPISILAGVQANSGTETLWRLMLGLTLWFALPLVGLSALALLLATSIVVRGSFSQLRGLSVQASSIGNSEEGGRLPLGIGPLEIQPFVEAVNEALDRMDEDFARRERFLAGAAHELRTPIAILQTRLDGIARTADIDRLRRDVSRLAAMAEQMLDLHRLGEGRREFDLVDLVAIARTVTSDMAPFVQMSGGAVSFETEGPSAPVRGDAAALERAIANLVHNAVEHGGPNIIVRVMSGAVEVEDDGEGVPSEERKRIFEPFYRRQSRSTGAGLGLSLVQQVARIHGGRAVARESVLGGARMRIELPTSDA